MIVLGFSFLPCPSFVAAALWSAATQSAVSVGSGCGAAPASCGTAATLAGGCRVRRRWSTTPVDRGATAALVRAALCLAGRLRPVARRLGRGGRLRPVDAATRARRATSARGVRQLARGGRLRPVGCGNWARGGRLRPMGCGNWARGGRLRPVGCGNWARGGRLRPVWCGNWARGVRLRPVGCGDWLAEGDCGPRGTASMAVGWLR